MNFKQLGANLGLDEDEYRELIDLFLTSGVADFNNLTLAIQSGDAEQAMRYAHAIKGASGNLGLREIYEAAGFIESRAVGKQLDDLTQAMATMQSQFNALSNLR